MLEVTTDVKEAIIQHARQDFPKEACGLLLDIGGMQTYYPCDNRAGEPEDYFRIDSAQNVEAEDLGEILAIVHSHPRDTCKASQADQVSCNHSELPWVIVGYPNIQFNTIYPSEELTPLIGRKFSHGVLDCYTLIKDYYSQELKIEIPEYSRENDWWDKGQDLYRDNFASAGFIDQGQQAEIHNNDVLLLRVKSKVPNHAVVYIGDEKIVHHLQDRLSCYDIYGGYWQKNLYTVLRHERFVNGTN